MQLRWCRTVLGVHCGHGLFAIALLTVACSSSVESPEGDPDVLGSALGGSAGQGAPATCAPVDVVDTVCDGSDEDCDGSVDEDCDFDAADCPDGYNVIRGTRDGDTLVGTVHDDCIVGFGGDDVIYGLYGDDLLAGGPGDDMIQGGTGDDTILGGAGEDDIEGGTGRDTIEGGDGNDRIEAGFGNDDVSGGLCHDLISGGFGRDDLRGDEGSDRIRSFRVWNSIDGGPGMDACSEANCEISLFLPACEQDSDCQAGTRCVLRTGICVSPEEVPFSDASCDGVDDDCSGQVDEDYEPTTTNCGVGACAATGTTVCEDGSEEDDCTPGTPAADDASCNAVDDDCDGASDEDFSGSATTCGTGACFAIGTTNCVNGSIEQSCTPGAPAADDASCDAVDEDCDGASDEGFAGAATSCGVGACAAIGMTMCTDGVEQNSCTPGAPAADDASCNAVDDDCDGISDEHFAVTATSCGVGACAAAGATSCVLGSVQDSCTPGAPAANDATCDGLDDDCDGTADEDFQASCSGTTSVTCSAGQLSLIACDDGDACNGAESCSAGACLSGTPVSVDDGDPCTSDSCNPQTGAVANDPVPAGTSCSDGELCNGEETCELTGGGGCALPSGAVAFWRGEGNADDSHGSHDGTLVDGTAFSTGYVGQAFRFDGSGDGVSLNAHAGDLDLAGTATIELWLRTTNDTCGTVFHLRQDSTREHYLQVGNNCTGTLNNELVTWTHVNGRSVSVVGFTTPSRSVLIDGSWHHLAVTLDGTQTSIYIDGLLQPLSIGSGTNHGDWGGFATPVNATIGARVLSTGLLAQAFAGNLDEVSLYDRALSAAEIGSIEAAGTEGKCTGDSTGGDTGGAITCTAGSALPSGTTCEDGGQCDGAGMCL